jgi:hypothetical protein
MMAAAIDGDCPGLNLKREAAWRFDTFRRSPEAPEHLGLLLAEDRETMRRHYAVDLADVSVPQVQGL